MWSITGSLLTGNGGHVGTMFLHPSTERNFYQNTPDGANVRTIIIFQWCYLFAVSHVWLLKWDNVSNRKTFQTKQQITISIILCDLDFKRPSNISGIQGWSGLGSMDILTVHIFIWNKLMNKWSPCSSMIFHILGYSKCSAKEWTSSLLVEGRKLVRSLNTIQYRKLILVLFLAQPSFTRYWEKWIKDEFTSWNLREYNLCQIIWP